VIEELVERVGRMDGLKFFGSIFALRNVNGLALMVLGGCIVLKHLALLIGTYSVLEYYLRAPGVF
jgi:hypothetical protein